MQDFVIQHKRNTPSSNPLPARAETRSTDRASRPPTGVGHNFADISVQRETDGDHGSEETPWWQNLAEGAAGLANMVIPGAGLVTEPVLAALGAKEGIAGESTMDKVLGAAHAVTGVTGLAAELGGFELLGAEGAGGLSVLGSGAGSLGGAAAAGELGTLGMAGPAAAVAGAGLAGVGVGMGLDKGVGALMNATGLSDTIDSMRGISRPEGQHGDYSLSGMGADIMTAADQGVTGVLRDVGILDSSKPEYTQTLGWQLASATDAVGDWLGNVF